MNRTISIILIVLLAMLAAAGLFFAGMAYSRARGTDVAAAGMRSGSGWGYFGPGSMMGRNPGWTVPGGRPGAWPGTSIGPDSPYCGGPAMWQGFRRAGGGPGHGCGALATAEPLTIDEARTAASAYLEELDITGLTLGEVIIFDNHAYVVVQEVESGLGAFELLVDPVSKQAHPEHGPNMMWNLKYGGVNHARMMWRALQDQAANPADVTADMDVSEEQASELAQDYLDAYLPGAAIAGDATPFYGYYTFDYEIDGQPAGMLSVNGASGEVFLHRWHGSFIEQAE